MDVIENGAAVFKGGLPCGPDIKKLDEAFDPEHTKKGTVIEYSDIADVIGVERSSTRFKTVLDRWRKHIEDCFGVVTDTHRGVGIVFSDSVNILDLSVRKAQTATAYARRAIKISHYIDVTELDEQGRETLTKTVKLSSMFIGEDIRKSKAELPTI